MVSYVKIPIKLGSYAPFGLLAKVIVQRALSMTLCNHVTRLTLRDPTLQGQCMQFLHACSSSSAKVQLNAAKVLPECDA
jgi:hypothetical protein